MNPSVLRVGRPFERQRLRQRQAQPAAADAAQQIVHALARLRRIAHVIGQAGAGEEQRPGIAQRHRRDRFHQAGGIAVQHHQPARPHALDRLVQRRRSHRVIGDIDAAAIAPGFHRCNEVLVAIENHMVGAQGFDELRLRGAADRRQHGRAKLFGKLHQHMSDAAGRGVDQTGHAGRQLAGIMSQVVRGRALRRQAGDVFQVDAIGNLGGTPRRHRDVLRVGSELLAIHHAVARLEVGYLRRRRQRPFRRRRRRSSAAPRSRPMSCWRGRRPHAGRHPQSPPAHSRASPATGPAPATGIGASISVSTSGPPNLGTTIIRIASSSPRSSRCVGRVVARNLACRSIGRGPRTTSPAAIWARSVRITTRERFHPERKRSPSPVIARSAATKQSPAR